MIVSRKKRQKNEVRQTKHAREGSYVIPIDMRSHGLAYKSVAILNMVLFSTIYFEELLSHRIPCRYSTVVTRRIVLSSPKGINSIE